MYGVYDRIDGPSDEDDFIHDPDGRKVEVGCFDQRGIVNLVVVVTIIVALILLFLGYPLIWHFTRHLSLWEQVVLNGTGQIPNLPLLPTMIDPDTPQDVYTRTGFDGQEYELVFSDEFETPGRSFYPGDDPFWEAVDLWVCCVILSILLSETDTVASTMLHRIWNGMTQVRHRISA